MSASVHRALAGEDLEELAEAAWWPRMKPRASALAEGGETVVTCETLEGTSIGHPVGEERAVA